MKIFGFFNVKNHKSAKRFRNIFANGVIACVLLSLFFITYSNSTVSVATSTESAIYYGDVESNKISLMINVYWGNEYLDDMLKTLKENDVVTTFFIGGTWAEKYPELLKKIYDDGHEIANHGYFHKDHATISYDKNKEEILNTHNLIKQQLGIDMTLFAPPSGSFSDTTIEIATALGYKTIMWTRDTVDWRDKDADVIYNRAIKNAKGGDFVLMHPTEKTAEALPRIIETLKANGFELTTVTNNLAE